MNTWISGKDFLKRHCQIKKLFIVSIKTIKDVDYMHAQKVFEEFKIKKHR